MKFNFTFTTLNHKAMSKYYFIQDLKIRVSDHEPNDSMNRLRGRNDIELYVCTIEGKVLSIQDQIERICEIRGLDVEAFSAISNDWKDGSYDANVFKSATTEEVESTTTNNSITALREEAFSKNMARLVGASLDLSLPPAELRMRIKELSEQSGVSQSFIKKHFNIR